MAAERFFAVERGGRTAFVRGFGPRPAAFGADEGERWAEMPRAPRPMIDRWDWAKKTLSVDLPLLAEQLCAAIDAERERRGAALLSAGRGVMLGYRRKGEEHRDFAGLGAALLATLNLDPVKRDKRFPWMTAEARRRNLTLPAVSKLIGDAIARDEAALIEIEAAAVAGKAAVRAAATEADMRAAAQINWSS